MSVEQTRLASGTRLNLDERTPGSSSLMCTLAEKELARVAGADELYVSTRRPDGSLQRHPDLAGPGLGRITSGGVEKDVTLEPIAELSDEVTAAYHAEYDRYGPGLVGTVTGGDVLERPCRSCRATDRSGGQPSGGGSRAQAVTAPGAAALHGPALPRPVPAPRAR
jgi:hypothetical protein